MMRAPLRRLAAGDFGFDKIKQISAKREGQPRP
jgi:hypothetical protein